jgi:hypothetical protein
MNKILLLFLAIFSVTVAGLLIYRIYLWMEVYRLISYFCPEIWLDISGILACFVVLLAVLQMSKNK